MLMVVVCVRFCSLAMVNEGFLWDGVGCQSLSLVVKLKNNPES